MELAAQHLTPGEIRFEVVRDGEESIAYLEGEGKFADRQLHPFPDLLLLDVRMPKLSGFQVLDWVRTHSHRKDLKVFVWADSQFESDVRRARAAGADRVIPKPNEMAALRQILRQIRDELLA